MAGFPRVRGLPARKSGAVPDFTAGKGPAPSKAYVKPVNARWPKLQRPCRIADPARNNWSINRSGCFLVVVPVPLSASS